MAIDGFWSDGLQGTTERLNQTLIQFDTTGNKPAAASTNKGLLYWDTTLLQLSRSNGSSYDIVGVGAGSLSVGTFVFFYDELNNGLAGGAEVIDWSTGKFQLSTLDQNVTYSFTSPGGESDLILRVNQDGAGGNTVTWPATVKWPGGTAPVIPAGGSSISIIKFHFVSSVYYGEFALDFS